MFKKKSNKYAITKSEIDFYIREAITLASSYKEQYKQLSFLGDYVTVDIANEWVWHNLKAGIMRIYNEELITEHTVDLYKEIDKNFTAVSLKGFLFEEVIWTLEGLEKHPFWMDQRKLAKEILDELVKIKID